MRLTTHRHLAAAAIACALLPVAAGTAAGAADPRDAAAGLGQAIGFLTGGANPDGANDFACKPHGPHPRPVVLVHGTFDNMRLTWNTLSPRLARDGYCVFALNYGDTSHGMSPIKAVGPIAASAKELARFVERVRAATGAPQVDIVGYSQGGLMARQYLRFEGGAARVHSLVALAPPNRGTKSLLPQTATKVPVLMMLVRGVCASCDDQRRDSAFIRTLNQGSMTMPGVEYTVISTVLDDVVVPYESQQLPPGPRVANITLQRVCPHNTATHLSMPEDPDALNQVRHALDRDATPPAACA